MSQELSPTGAPVTPITSLDDPRVIQILSTEHWSQLTSRSLAYNEAFTRGGMFLVFLSTSFVALGLLAQGVTFDGQFLAVAAVVLAFDLVVGLATYGRIAGANADDLRAAHGMARIRHAYTEIAPIVAPYFTAPSHDDIESVLTVYGKLPSSGLGQVLYALTTSGGMIGLITSMVGGILAAVLGLIIGMSGGLAVLTGVGGFVLVFAVLLITTLPAVSRAQAALGVMFPAPDSAVTPE